MLSEVDKLKRHIDPSQVTFDLGGYLPYSHDDWIKLRYVSTENPLCHNLLFEGETCNKPPTEVLSLQYMR